EKQRRRAKRAPAAVGVPMTKAAAPAASQLARSFPVAARRRASMAFPTGRSGFHGAGGPWVQRRQDGAWRRPRGIAPRFSWDARSHRPDLPATQETETRRENDRS